MFNQHLCNLMAGNKIGAGYSGGCWRATGVTMGQRGVARALSAPPTDTSPTSTSAISRQAGSRSRVSARSTRYHGRWEYRSMLGLMIGRNTKTFELGNAALRGGVHLGT